MGQSFTTSLFHLHNSPCQMRLSFACSIVLGARKTLPESRADLGMGQGGPGPPFCPGIFFSFVNVCQMVLEALLFE